MCDSSGDSKVWYKEDNIFGPEEGSFFIFMDDLTFTRTIIGILAILVVLVYSAIKLFFTGKEITSKFIVKTGIFSAISIILYSTPYLKFSVPFFPSFLELHFDEIPALIAGLAYGPMSAFFVLIIKTIVKLPMTSTLCVGEISDLVFSLAFVMPTTLIYKKRRDITSAFFGIFIGILFQVTVASLGTTFVVLDFYVNLMGISKEQILSLCQAINPHIHNLKWEFLFIFEVPFNCFKDMIVGVITFILYKRLHILIDKIGAQKN